jgi:hypothetical protein
VVTAPDTIAIVHRLLHRRRLIDLCALDHLWTMSRLPSGALDLPALRANVSAMFPTATERQVTRALTIAQDHLTRRPSAGATVHRLDEAVQLELFDRRPLSFGHRQTSGRSSPGGPFSCKRAAARPPGQRLSFVQRNGLTPCCGARKRAPCRVNPN